MNKISSSLFLISHLSCSIHSRLEDGNRFAKKSCWCTGIKTVEVKYIVFERRVSFDSKIENRKWTACEMNKISSSLFLISHLSVSEFPVWKTEMIREKELLVYGIKTVEVKYIVFERRVSFDSKIENRDWTAFEYFNCCSFQFLISNLECSIHSRLEDGNELVGATGFEPATTCPPCKCATRLRYAPTSLMVEAL